MDTTLVILQLSKVEVRVAVLNPQRVNRYRRREMAYRWDGYKF